ncbi:beta-glucosidase BglX [Flavobacteriaceae bacterium]|jgi:beta-glucosidase|nr:beta-glucosidase BglX [Flavobacteriaceae bacterium]MDA9588259.1 beta-glucosidase BglX [Flavobacteriaceae bacterium]MDC3240917.1 beta-glucosidase BglX [Flavobacteriaceae bacterium]
MKKLFLFVFFVHLNNLFAQQLDPAIESKVNALIDQMTIEEKIGQMNQYNGFWNVTGPTPKEGDAAEKFQNLASGLVGSMLNVRGVEEVREVQKIAVEQTRLGIPLIIGFDLIHGYKTVSPIPLAESASWDLESIKRSAELAAKEAAAAGINWTFAPMVDITRDARWGRVMEGAGEDPFLGSQIAIARVKGFQGEDLSLPGTIAACAKHFAGYGFAEAGRDYNTVDIGLNTLHNMVLPPFKAAADAGVRTFMNSFNDLNGIPSTADRYLQRDILKKDWNFNGFVVSDWGSIREMIDHGYAKDRKHAGELALKGGSDMDMESLIYIEHLKSLLEEGKVKVSEINDAVRRILRVKFELGLFEDPYRYCNETREQLVTGSKEIVEGALDMAKKSIVLLKNHDKLLPLKKKDQKIALIGPLAADKNSPLGNWRIAAENESAISLLEGMKNYKGNELIYEQGVRLINKIPAGFHEEVDINEDDYSGIEAAVRAAENSDIVIMVLGEYGFQSGEGRSRAHIDLPGLQQDLLEAVYEVNKNIVLVLMNGRPLILNWADEHIPAILESWHLGSQSGHAIAQVLYGDYNPSGKLPMSFPRSEGQLPIYYNQKSTGRPGANGGDNGSVFWSHYGDEKNSPLYPFGFGLSYTTFSYSDIQLSNDIMNDGEDIIASVIVKNTGNKTGKEVVQLYLKDHYASAVRPTRELKGFELVELKPGESKKIEFKINRQLLSFYNALGVWEAEKGDFTVFIGTDSNTKRKASFVLN